MQKKLAVKHKQSEKNKLSNLSVGTVHLNVKDLERLKNFYHQVIGLDILNQTEQTITLGKGKNPLLTLHHRNDLTHAASNHAGLYHFAILFSSRADLARTVHRILKHSPQHFSGSADHLVSEAFYFNDPEGNGIELYFDRERTLWQWENNQIKMASMYIDPIEYIQQHIVLEKPEAEVIMGHVHLKVGDIEAAQKFYVDILGFDVTAKLPGALFISVDGYHHNIGMNTWESEGALKRNLALGLNNFELIFSSYNDIESFKNRLADNKIEYTEISNGLQLHDPWKNTITAKLLIAEK